MESKIPELSCDKNPLWFNMKNLEDSDNDNDELANSSFDIALAGASTPLKIRNGDNSDNVVFLSPMAKLNNLHLESKYDLPKYEGVRDQFDSTNNDTEDTEECPDITVNYDDYEGEDNDEEDYDGNYGLGNKTIRNDTESESENDGDTSSNGSPDDSAMTDTKPPRYVNLRKRQYTDSPLDMVITPVDNNVSVTYNTTASVFHLSISQSDSTPCPTQPRKKLKFKNNSNDITPSQTGKQYQRKRLLDLSNSVKTSASTLIHKFNDIDLDHYSDNEDFKEESTPISMNTTMFSSSAANQQSTPISQSTPSNSRPPSPEIESEEVGNEINGYKFVKPVRKLNQVTPNANRLKLQSLKDSYNTRNYDSSAFSGKYEIVGELPVTSMGMMNESDDDIHFADKRINDPYLSKINCDEISEEHTNSIRTTYFEGTTLPLNICFEKHSFEKEEILRLINDDDSVIRFFNMIKLPDETLLELIKKERVRWHPDRWISKLETSTYFKFDKEIIDNLSQVLNAIVEDLS